MELVDVEALVGDRVFVETEPTSPDVDFGRAYVGTLKKITETSLCLSDWIMVNEWDMSHIVDYSNGKDLADSWEGDLYLCTVGFLREVKTIEKNLKRGDPYVQSD